MRDALTEGRRLELAWSERRGQVVLRATGWTAAELHQFDAPEGSGLGRWLAVLPADLVEEAAGARGWQPIAGRFERDGDAVSFVPRFPFVAGSAYSLVVSSDTDREREVWTLELPGPVGAATTEVTAIHPTATSIPLNTLRIYIEFSAPMSEGWARRSVHVLRADDRTPLAGVFLGMTPELWDHERKRLTLLLDPGRIKRGLKPNEEAGYPLTAGVPLVVTVDSSFRDAGGRTLRASADRRYEVSAALRSRINPAGWRLKAPAAGSAAPLKVTFGRPLDHALLRHCIAIQDATGAPVLGGAAADPHETGWRFAPATPWRAGRYALVVDPRLEDATGNSVTRVFDRDLLRSEDEPAEQVPATIPFSCS